ncbi:hypothetical protein [Pseudoalteromonas rubra]|uniref:hypothetical protein n=1 Tax=Pseudoalteromonas rubra TaxID=43658 RepID=UPI002DBBAC1C|nr:hypothetical protein [Pseudoalteromonas rubra]MEC4091581.1 hypothetical protein [Pseudoalteromonas rubra]
MATSKTATLALLYPYLLVTGGYTARDTTAHDSVVIAVLSAEQTEGKKTALWHETMKPWAQSRSYLPYEGSVQADPTPPVEAGVQTNSTTSILADMVFGVFKSVEAYKAGAEAIEEFKVDVHGNGTLVSHFNRTVTEVMSFNDVLALQLQELAEKAGLNEFQLITPQ